MNDNGISCELGGNVKRRCVEEGTTDRLSHLPDFIIHHIFSFLDTKEAVQTSVLSRLWRCPWKHVPVLHFRSDSFEQYLSFQRYVENVLSLRDPVAVVSKIEYIDNEDSHELDSDLFDKVIKFASSHDTQHLVIDLDSNSLCCDYTFSDLFGTTSSFNFRTLELKCVLIDDGFASSGFGMLTTLSLESCELGSSELGEDLDPFSSCPCLQNLVLDHCSHIGKITGPQLLSLRLHSVFCSSWEEIEIFAPRLKSLSLLPELEDMKFSKLTVPSLDHVDIRVTDMSDFLEGNEECVRQRFISLFQHLNNATSLTFGPHSIRVLSSMSEFLEQQPSPFRRLKSLIMEADNVPYTLINYFLKGSSMKPNLEFV